MECETYQHLFQTLFTFPLSKPRYSHFLPRMRNLTTIGYTVEEPLVQPHTGFSVSNVLKKQNI